ncbi:MAG: hypothetical protein K2X98_05525 [Alphaproteobacteria bacterium]|nr:hypothetical protein [Alphaproteobacteria bacterium]
MFSSYIDKKYNGYRLPLKLSFIALGITIFSLSLLSLLIYKKYDSALSHSVSSRFFVIADDLLHTVSNSLNLGLNLDELQSTQAIIQNIKNKDPTILCVGVFELTSSHAGKIVYNTRHERIGGNIPTSWVDLIQHSEGKKFWFLDEEDEGIVGVTLYNNFHQPIGGIVVRYDQRHIDNKLSMFAKKLFLYTVVLTAVIFIFVFCLFYYCFHSLLCSLKKMQMSLPSIFKGDSFVPFIIESDLESHFYDMHKKTKVLLETFAALEHQTTTEVTHEKCA